MNCPSCGTVNEAGRKFCGECGTRLSVVCASCGTANTPGARFCGECGNGLDVSSAGPAASIAGSGAGASAGTAPTGVAGGSFAGNGATGASGNGASPTAGPVAERRLVTVLFADLVGFTTLSEGRDPEDV